MINIRSLLRQIERKIYSAYKQSMKHIDSHRESLILFFYHELSWFYLTNASKLYYEQRYANDGSDDYKKHLSGALVFGERRGVPIGLIKKSFKTKVIDFIVTIFFSIIFRKKIYMGYSSLTRIEHIKIFFKHHCAPKYQPEVEIFFPEMEKQFAIFDELCSELNDLLGFDRMVYNDVTQTARELLGESYKFSLNGERFKPRERSIGCIQGSTGQFYNRRLAFATSGLSLPVLGILHADESGAYHSPSWLYDDWATADYLVGYGPGGRDYLEQYKVISIRKSINYYESDSELARASFKSHEVSDYRPMQGIHNGKGLYIERRMKVNNGVINSNNWSDYIAYGHWRMVLLESCKFLDVKIHPKGSYQDIYGVDVSSERRQTSSLSNLDLFVDNYDYFVIDHVDSTAFTTIATTKLPIVVFLDKNHDVLSPEAYKKVAERCHIINFDSDNPRAAIDEFLNIKKIIGKRNIFTQTYSLSSSKTSRLQAIDLALIDMNISWSDHGSKV